MIERLRIQNYKPLRDVSLELTPIHVLIGPNDSGKTSILEATAALCRSVEYPLSQMFTGSWDGRQLIWRGSRDVAISMAALVRLSDATFEYKISLNFGARDRAVKLNDESVRFLSEQMPVEIGQKNDAVSKVCRIAVHNEPVDDDVKKRAMLVSDSLLGVQSYRWNPQFLALPVAPDSKRHFRMDPSGFGLALCLDDILGFDRDRFVSLETRFKTVFPQFKSIKLIAEPAFRAPVDDLEGISFLHRGDGKGIHFESAGGDDQLISARQVSDGVLFVLAYLTILYLPQPPRLLLIEEPENGIHPKRLRDVLSILRELVGEQTRTQVILTTHSPYVVDLFAPEEVTLCHKDKRGAVQVRRLSESVPVREQLDVFTLGEIWTAEGDDALAESVSTTDNAE